ncbi:MAG: 30S ribosome-binding factor RbfA [Bacteroidia bacterium]|nr:30S ribosome-binding factor RbfA [Bacteroidia bacterium]
MEESTVQKKTAKLIQQEMSGILLHEKSGIQGALLTVSEVRVTADLSLARIYVSLFPPEGLEEAATRLNARAWEYRKLLAQRIRNKVRSIPELRFLPDGSFAEADRMDQLMRDLGIGGEAAGTDPDAAPAA